ncbi:uncharacterized protein LOC115243823 [Formica exsecta]|uniref:uncharacterized protein LOC115243823 n=1 Tax=Formica exsecta TaxID=72781 RepID=UPI0011440C40|nr:uncharacterized protein LOC115243823 [Formica exsecta]
MVSQFPLDYMHLVCLGVVKKMLQTFIHGRIKAIKFNSTVIQEISEVLCNISTWIPNDFARKTRSLEELDRWKATELRLFLLYVGPVILQNYLPQNYLLHFNSLHCAIRILCHESDCINNNEYAKDLLVYFVETSKILYGKDFIISNVHNLIHISDDVIKFGHLDSFSSFTFENFLYEIKKQLKKGEKPLEQLHNRIVERVKNKKTRHEYFSKPQVAHYNSKKSNGTRLAYDYIFYKIFKLSLKKESDSFCYLKSNDIFHIKNIYKYNKESIMQGKILINLCNLPHYPVNSELFNISVGNEWSKLKNFSIDEINMKAICIPYKNSFCFFPIIHLCV